MTDDTRLMSWEMKVIGALGALVCTLAVFWLQNIWVAVEAERRARADMSNSMSSNFLSKEAAMLIANNRERQIEEVIRRIDRVQTQLVDMEKRFDELSRNMKQP